MAPKKKAAITDRATAKKAKAYVYGVKTMRNLAAVKKTNIYQEKLVTPGKTTGYYKYPSSTRFFWT